MSGAYKYRPQYTQNPIGPLAKPAKCRGEYKRHRWGSKRNFAGNIACVRCGKERNTAAGTKMLRIRDRKPAFRPRVPK